MTEAETWAISISILALLVSIASPLIAFRALRVDRPIISAHVVAMVRKDGRCLAKVSVSNRGNRDVTLIDVTIETYDGRRTAYSLPDGGMRLLAHSSQGIDFDPQQRPEPPWTSAAGLYTCKFFVTDGTGATYLAKPPKGNRKV